MKFEQQMNSLAAQQLEAFKVEFQLDFEYIASLIIWGHKLKIQLQKEPKIQEYAASRDPKRCSMPTNCG
jgi:hypothetical protein